MNEERFKYIWKLLCKTYKENGHCMKLGSSRETLACWVGKTCNVHHPAWIYRDVLIEAISRNWVKKQKSKHGYSQFIIIV